MRRRGVASWSWNLYLRRIADGTVIWTSPSGYTYTTTPGSRLLVPALSIPTRDLPSPPPRERARTNRGVMMPTRVRTRAEDSARRKTGRTPTQKGRFRRPLPGARGPASVLGEKVA